MELDPASLPDDVEALRAIVLAQHTEITGQREPIARLRLQLAQAVREGDDQAVGLVMERARRVAPEWDAEAELAALTAGRRQRRRNQRPAWLAWLTRIAHPGRTRP